MSITVPRGNLHSQPHLSICGGFTGALRLFPFSLWGRSDGKSLLPKLQPLWDFSAGTLERRNFCDWLCPHNEFIKLWSSTPPGYKAGGKRSARCKFIPLSSTESTNWNQCLPWAWWFMSETPTHRKQSQEDPCESETSLIYLIYIASSVSYLVKWNPILPPPTPLKKTKTKPKTGLWRWKWREWSVSQCQEQSSESQNPVFMKKNERWSGKIPDISSGLHTHVYICV